MKLDRLIGILAALLQRGRCTAPELAARFEVSRRTVNRDIEALCRAGIPIAAIRGPAGGFEIMEGYRLDRMALTRDDLRAILAGLRGLDSVDGSDRCALLMEKLSPGASSMVTGDERMLIDLASWYGPSLSEKMTLIRRAMDVSHCVRFRYHSPKGESLRFVEPGLMVFKWTGWYLWGWCRTRDDWRLFKLNRMTELTMGEVCAPRAVQPPDLDSKQVFPENMTVEAVVEPEHRWRLIEEYGADSFEQLPDGRLWFRFGFADHDQAIGWMLSFQGGAELIRPAWLRRELAGIGRRIAGQYADEGEIV